MLPKETQQGFTLIELILVMAISGALLLIAFMGQGQLRAQAQFDASLNKLVSSIADAHNEATAGINVAGKGDGTNGCGASGAGLDYVFAGVAWVASASGDIRMDFYKAVAQSPTVANSCVFTSQKITFPAPIAVNMSMAGSFKGATEIFVRNNDQVNVCPVPDSSINVSTYFRSGACTGGKQILSVTDDQGRKAQVTIDPSGLARRDF